MNPPLESPLRVGFVGVGKMGLPMALDVAALGHDVIAVETHCARRERAAGSGLGAVRSVGELPTRTQLVFSSLLDDRALLSVVDDVARIAQPGWCLLDASTVSLEASQDAARALDEVGVAYLRVPVLGNAGMAEAAPLTTLASGPRALFERVRPLLATWGPTQFNLGVGEEARLMKLVLSEILISGGPSPLN